MNPQIENLNLEKLFDKIMVYATRHVVTPCIVDKRNIDNEVIGLIERESPLNRGTCLNYYDFAKNYQRELRFRQGEL